MKKNRSNTTTTTTTTQDDHNSNGNNTTTLQKLFIKFAAPQYDKWYIFGLLVFELCVCYGVIIPYVPYTEIDWKAYMEEVEGWWIYGHTNYYLLQGSTGPLVYPAGFLYVFTVFRLWTQDGTNIQMAQHLFGIVYVVQLWIVLLIYTKCMRTTATMTSTTTTIWKWRVGMLCLCLSKRIHSIFVLRLFNDGIATFFFYLALFFFLHNTQWKFGCFLFSLAVSIKMNILLYAPGLLLLLLQQKNYWKTLVCLSICALTQAIVGLPFLTTYPEAYLRKAFEFDRTFFYVWTVNWKCIPESIFLSKYFAILLLSGHLSTLYYYLVPTTTTTTTTVNTNTAIILSPSYIVYTLFISNYIGICFARTLHYQFYAWYFHTLPFMLLCNTNSNNNKAILLLLLLLLACIDYSFSYVFPATAFSSLLLQVSQWTILFGFLQTPQQLFQTTTKKKNE